MKYSTNDLLIERLKNRGFRKLSKVGDVQQDRDKNGETMVRLKHSSFRYTFRATLTITSIDRSNVWLQLVLVDCSRATMAGVFRTAICAMVPTIVVMSVTK